jgi:hypothetical protein
MVQAEPSGVDGALATQAPLSQTFAPVQTSPSVHDAPSFAFASQEPARHVAPALQPLPSPQAVPSGALDPARHACVGPPLHVRGLQTSSPQAWPAGSGVPATHAPLPSQNSLPLQGLSSEHDAPAGRGAITQAPVRHAPACKHAVAAAHSEPSASGFWCTHEPAPSQTSTPLHALASSPQGVPAPTGVDVVSPVAGSQETTTQWFRFTDPNP